MAATPVDDNSFYLCHTSNKYTEKKSLREKEVNIRIFIIFRFLPAVTWSRWEQITTDTKTTGWNDKIVALEKTTWFHFRLMKTDFLFFFFFFIADHLLVGQLCTNPKSDRSLLSCLKVTQYSTSKIGDAPRYKSCSLPIQVMTTGPLPAPSIATNKRDVPRVMKTKFPATVMVFGVVSNEGHIMPPHIFEVILKVNTKVYLDVLKSVLNPWCNQVAGGRPWVWQHDSAPAHKSKETQAWFRRSTTTLYPSHTGPPPPPTWTRGTTSFGHTSRTSPTWPPTTPKPVWSPTSAENSPSSRQRLWKRHAPSSGSVSKRRLKLKAATLNRCQLYKIIKLAELIFSIKVLK